MDSTGFLADGGLAPYPQSRIHLLDLGGHRCSQTHVCIGEVADAKTQRGGLQDLAEAHLEYLLSAGPLCVMKEFPCGHGGAVDFLAVNGEGLVFLVEVKRAKDQRAQFDVVFQVLKYHCFPAEILQRLASPFLETKLQKALGLGQAAASVAERARKNVENRLMNPVIVVDEASYPLIAHAYSLALRDIQGEMRVIEVNVQAIQSADKVGVRNLLYVRKYFSNDAWIGNACSNNRKPTEYTSLEEKLAGIADDAVQRLVLRLLDRTGTTVTRVAKREKSITIVTGRAYFTFDPDGKISQGVCPRTAKPANPYRIVVIDPNLARPKALLDAGFNPVSSFDGKRTYHVFELTPATTDADIDRIAAILGTLKSRPSDG